MSLLQLQGRRRNGGCKAGAGLDWAAVVCNLLAGRSGPAFLGDFWSFPCVPVRTAPGGGVGGECGLSGIWHSLSALLLLATNLSMGEGIPAVEEAKLFLIINLQEEYRACV